MQNVASDALFRLSYVKVISEILLMHQSFQIRCPPICPASMVKSSEEGVVGGHEIFMLEISR